MNQTCNVWQTIIKTTNENNVTSCLCHTGFQGEFCEERISWMVNYLISFHIIQTFLTFISLILCIMRVISFCKNPKSNKALLAKVTLAIVIISNIFMLIYDFMPSVVLFADRYSSEITLVKSILLYLTQILRLIATTIIFSFWYDALKMKSEKISKSRVFVLCLALFQFVFAVVGSFISFSSFPQFAGVPLDIVVVICIIVSIIHMNYIRKQNIIVNKSFNSIASVQSIIIDDGTEKTSTIKDETEGTLTEHETIRKKAPKSEVTIKEEKDYYSKISAEYKRRWVVIIGIINISSLALSQIFYYLSIILVMSGNNSGILVTEMFKQLLRAILPLTLILLIDYRLLNIRSLFFRK